MSRSMNVSTPVLASPQWAGDTLGRPYLLPGGAKLDAAAFSAGADGKKRVPSGTIVGRTIAERDASAGFGPAAATDEEIYIVAFDVLDAATLNDVELCRPNAGLVVKENFLPGWAGLAAGVKTLVRAAFVCTRGAE